MLVFIDHYVSFVSLEGYPFVSISNLDLNTFMSQSQPLSNLSYFAAPNYRPQSAHIPYQSMYLLSCLNQFKYLSAVSKLLGLIVWSH